MLLSILQGTRLLPYQRILCPFPTVLQLRALVVGKCARFKENDFHIFVFPADFKTILLWWILPLFVCPEFLNMADLSFVLSIKFGNILAINSASIPSARRLFSLLWKSYYIYAGHLISAPICLRKPFSHSVLLSGLFLWCQAHLNSLLLLFFK